MVWMPCSECIICDIMRKYRNDSLINEHKSMDMNIHNNTSAGTVLQAIQGGKVGRPAVEQFVAICRRSLTSDDSRTGVQRTANCSIDDTTPPAIAVISNFTSRRSPHSDHFTNVVVQLLHCRLSRPPRVSTDVTQRRREDNLQVI